MCCRMKQECAKIAWTRIHIITSRKRSSDKNAIRRIKQNYAAIVVGVVFSRFTNNSRCTLYEFVLVNKQLMTHLMWCAVMVEHLGIHVVKSRYLYIYDAIMVFNSAWSVLYKPVPNCPSCYCEKTNPFLVRGIRCEWSWPQIESNNVIGLESHWVRLPLRQRVHHRLFPMKS